MAAIKKYRGDVWRARVRKVGYPPQSKTFGTKTAAEKWARGIEAEIDRGGQALDVKGARGVSVASVFERYRDEVTPIKKTSKGERNTIKRLLGSADFMHRRLNQIKPDDIRVWRDARLKQVTPASVNREFTTISSILTYAIKEWGVALPANPALQVSRPKGADVHRDQRWSDEDIVALLKAANWKEGHKPATQPEYVGWAVLVALETAMRMGEICSLVVGEFHAKERYVYLDDTKNGDSRMVPLSTKALQYFKCLTDGRKKDERIFPPTESLGLYFRAARNAAGLSGQRFHDLRHESATRLSKKFSNVLELSAVTGHRSLQSLKRYYNPTPGELAAKMG